MSRELPIAVLSAAERQVANLHLGGATEPTIAQILDTSQGTVNSILRRPKVARYIMQVSALCGANMAESIENLNEAIEHAATRAFDVEVEAMERLFNLDNPEDRRYVHAQTASATIAQDILDRAGKRAPTRVQQSVTYGIDDKTLNELSRVVKEHETIDVTPTSKNGRSHEAVDRIPPSSD